MTQSKLTTDLMISAATAPLLLLLVGTRSLASFMTQMGQASEELFRGDRLPVLKISALPNSTPGHPPQM